MSSLELDKRKFSSGVSYLWFCTVLILVSLHNSVQQSHPCGFVITLMNITILLWIHENRSYHSCNYVLHVFHTIINSTFS